MNISTDQTALPAPRLNFFAFGPDAMRAMGTLDQRITHSDLEKSLIELVRLRVSQINGCAFCIARHTTDALRIGEDKRRLTALPAWRDTPFFTTRERAALAWAEALTRIADAHVPDDLWKLVEGVFVPSQLIDLTLAINAVNGWNRFAIAFRKLPS
jgi:AhpD family alkylhydroperoxidase